jgi:hypothetical protein
VGWRKITIIASLGDSIKDILKYYIRSHNCQY